MSEEPQEIRLDDESWERVLKATDGAAAPCFQCGVCTATCPWGLVRDETVSIRKMVRQAQLGLDGAGEELWLCTTCGACGARCPREVPIAKVIQGLRSLAWEDRRLPEGLPTLLWSVYWDGNPWARPPSERNLWAKDLNIKEFSPDDEILYYVGCTPSYDRRVQKVAKALIGLLDAAGVRYGTLGEKEPCCGDAVRSLGNKPYLMEMIGEASKVFEEAGVKKLVATSPHCYDMFKNEYPNLSGDFEPLHYTQYLAQLIEEGRLKLDGEVKARVTFQDPCYLGRRNKEYDAPRKILQSIPGIELVEMENSCEDALCCGGGGGRMFMETEAKERFSNLRIEEVKQTGADILVTACPHCMSCLEDSAKFCGAEDLRVLDVAEVAYMALTGKEKPRKAKKAAKKTAAARRS